jgi:DNA-binding CsgD family transcriptional regulator/tetratricopeptide (TPR) repeat protein
MPADRRSAPAAAAPPPSPPSGDTGAVATRVTSSRLIGREPELAELEAALADAGAQRPSLAFVAGESGVGKSRLLAELERRARQAGARVIGGDCVELGDGELPYAPIVAALRPLARAGDPVLDELGPAGRAELARLLPELGPPASDTLDDRSGSAQARLFEALLGFLDRLGRDAPVVLSIEDIHWADSSTRAFVAFLARSLCRERVLVVATYRPDELHRRHPLRPLLAELERGARARRIELPALTRPELTAALDDILGAAADAALVERLWARSEGNPLFAEELLAAGLDGRGDLPPTLRDALMVRIERLSDTAQELLRLLAAGQRLDHALLAEVSGLDARTLREALREAVSGHILVADAEDRYAFRHALLREVLHDDLLPGERAELHLALARALEKRAGRDGAGAHLAAGIAHHYFTAGDQPAAFAASSRAAAAAEQVQAHGEAAALWERCLALWERVPDPEALAGADRVEVLVRAAWAHELRGNLTRVEVLLREALSRVDAGRHPHQTALLLARIARAQHSLGRDEEAMRTGERGLALLPAGDISRERAQLLAWRAKVLMLQSRYSEAIPAAHEAVAVARAAGNAAAESRALNAAGVSLMAIGEREEGRAMLVEALELARQGRRMRELESAYINLADSLHLAGQSAEALEIARTGWDELIGQGRPCDWLVLLRAEIAIDIGRWDEAHRTLPAPETRFVGSTRTNVELRRGELALLEGDDASARAHLDMARESARDSTEPQVHGPLGALTAELERRAGELDAARAAILASFERLDLRGEDLMRIARVAATGAAVEADAAQRARDLGDDQAEAEAIARAEGMVRRVRESAVGERPVERAQLARAEAELARARGEDDPRRWAATALAWEAAGRPYFAAAARRNEAEALVAAGDRDAAAARAAEVRAAARALGAHGLLREVTGLAARARLRLDDGDGDGNGNGDEGDGQAEAAQTAGDEDPFGLTPREQQVLTLVARGATNREIGAELFMAEKTASVHVSRILAKLDVRSRTEAAAVAHRQGLAV